MLGQTDPSDSGACWYGTVEFKRARGSTARAYCGCWSDETYAAVLFERAWAHVTGSEARPIQ